jgi:hypothetical protein
MLAAIVLTTIPAALLGVVLALLLTGTTINIQSFMGAIMAVSGMVSCVIGRVAVTCIGLTQLLCPCSVMMAYRRNILGSEQTLLIARIWRRNFLSNCIWLKS